MKKLISALTLMSSLVFCCLPSAYSAPSQSGAAAKAALKEKFKNNVATLDNGDVILKGFPDADFSKLQGTDLVSDALLVFLTYVDSEIDFKALDKAILRETGGKKGSVPIKSIMQGVSKYLGRYNMQLQKVPVSGSGVSQKIDDGTPIIIYILADSLYGKIADRTQKRRAAKSIDDWTKDLRKLEIKKFPKGHIFANAIIAGYNKKSGEYLVLGVSRKPVWMTEKEVRNLMLAAYQLRF